MKLLKWLQTQEVINYLQGSDQRPKEWGRFLCRFFGWEYWEGAGQIDLWDSASARSALAESPNNSGFENLTQPEGLCEILESQIPTIVSRAEFCISLATNLSFTIPHKGKHSIVDEIRALTPGQLALIQVPVEHQLLFYACVARVKHSRNAPLDVAESLLAYMASPKTVSWRKFATNLEWNHNDFALILFRDFVKIWSQEGL